MRLPAQVRVVSEGAASALLDGGGGLGHVPADTAMRMAIAKARETGTAASRGAQLGSLRRGRQLRRDGRGGRRASGIATTNAPPPAVVPTFGAEPMLGTNPTRVCGARGRRNRPSCSTWRRARHRSESVLTAWRARAAGFPSGWAIDRRGSPIRNGRVAAQQRRLTPLGSTPETASHKGYGLAAMVEILSLLPAARRARPGEDRRSVTSSLAIDPAAFAANGESEADLDALIDSLRASRPLDPRTARARAGRPGARGRASSGCGTASRSRAASLRTSARSRAPAGVPFSSTMADRRDGSSSARKLYGSAVSRRTCRGQRTVAVRAARADRGAAATGAFERSSRYAATSVPYYRELFEREGIDPREIRGAADLDGLPLLDRELVRARPGAVPRRRRAGRERPLVPHQRARPARRCASTTTAARCSRNIAYGEREREPVIEGTGGSFRPKELYVGNETSTFKTVAAFYEREHAAARAAPRRFVSVREPIERVAAIARAERPDLLVGYGGWIAPLLQDRRRARLGAPPPEDGDVHGGGSAARAGAS